MIEPEWKRRDSLKQRALELAVQVHTSTSIPQERITATAEKFFRFLLDGKMPPEKLRKQGKARRK